MKCPACSVDNLDDSKFCRKCASPLHPDVDPEVSFTKTLQTPSQGIHAGSTFASRYTIVQELGRGGMGVVYKAEDSKLERTVALKLLPPHLIGDSDAKERFIREARAAAKLDHPHICTVHEIAETEDGQVYIAMACYDGQSLKDRSKKGPLPYEEAVDVAVQLSRGLDKAHNQGIIHRDIKPANIMATTDGVIKIVDFGLAKLSGQVRVTKTGTTMGTVAYMSPEQARGELVDQRTDIWAVGVVLYEMLTGNLPFAGEHEQSMMYAIMNKDPEPIAQAHPDIPQDLDNIILKALEKKPEDRYEHIHEFLDDLNSVLKGLAPEKAGSASRRVRATKLRPAIILPLIAVFVVISTFLGWLLFFRGSDSIDSIAVLPLLDHSNHPDQEFYADSLTDAIIHKIGQISALKKVTPYFSVMRYKGTDKAISEIGGELSVKVVLTGSIIRSEGNLRMLLQLIDVKTETSLWQDEYDRKLTDIIILQEEIAQTIANEINIELTPDEQRRLSSNRQVGVDVYDLVMKGWHHIRTGAFPQSQKCFQDAIDLDPNFAPAYVGLSRSYAGLNVLGLLSPHEAFPKSREMALKALELDEDSADAHDRLAWVKWWHDWDWDGAESEYQRALEINPSLADATRFYGLFLGFCRGRFDEALTRVKHGVDLDPFFLIGRLNLAETYWFAGQRELAWKEINDVIEKSPNFVMAFFYAGYFFTKEKNWAEAIRAFEKTLELMPGFARGKAYLGHIYGKMGDRSKAMQIYDELVELSENKYISATLLALVSVGLNDSDMAFEWLSKSIEQRDRELPIIDKLAGFEDLQNDPRFDEVLKRIGLDPKTLELP